MYNVSVLIFNEFAWPSGICVAFHLPWSEYGCSTYIFTRYMSLFSQMQKLI